MFKGKYLFSTNILLLLVLIVTLTSLILIFKLLKIINFFNKKLISINKENKFLNIIQNIFPIFEKKNEKKIIK